MEVLKQDQYEPMPMENQVAIIFALTNGHLDDVPVEKIKTWEKDFYKYMKNQKVLKDIAEKKELDEKIISELDKKIKEFKEVYQSNT